MYVCVCVRVCVCVLGCQEEEDVDWKERGLGAGCSLGSARGTGEPLAHPPRSQPGAVEGPNSRGGP